MNRVIVRVDAAIGPPFREPHTDLTFTGQVFEISVAGNRVTAQPLPGTAVDFDAATTILEREIAPYLAVLSAETGTPAELMGPTRYFVDTMDATREVKGDHVSSTLTMPFSVEGPTWKADFARRVKWAQDDPIYRDLCDLLAAGQASPNPRPDACKMIERLEKKFDGRARALKALGLNDKDIRILVADQATFRGDRHADFPIGEVPARLDTETRRDIIKAAGLVRRRYEEMIFGASLES